MPLGGFPRAYSTHKVISVSYPYFDFYFLGDGYVGPVVRPCYTYYADRYTYTCDNVQHLPIYNRFFGVYLSGLPKGKYPFDTGWTADCKGTYITFIDDLDNPQPYKSSSSMLLDIPYVLPLSIRMSPYFDKVVVSADGSNILESEYTSELKSMWNYAFPGDLRNVFGVRL